MVYGYARVSTSIQAKNGNSLEYQESVLKENGASKIFFDAFTGTKKHRPQFDILMSMLAANDVLIVTKLDRIARSAIQGSEIVMELLDKGVKVNILNLGVMDNTPSGKLIRTIFFAFAEFERDMIVERTAEGKAIERERDGYVEGRPQKPVKGFELLLKKQQNGDITVLEGCKRLGISKTQWYRLQNAVPAKHTLYSR